MTAQKKHEISTVAERTITLRLSDAAVERILKWQAELQALRGY